MKQGLNFFILVCLILFTLFRGSKKFHSIIGIKSCSVEDWSMVIAFLLTCICLSYYALKTLRKEQWLKEKFGRGLASTEVKVISKSDVSKLMFGSFAGGLVSGSLGQGGSSIYNPMLLSFGCAPVVSSATGMYMIIFSSAASTVVYTITGTLQWDYASLIGGCAVIGTFAGMKAARTVMAKLGRQSPLVMLLTAL